MTVQELEKLKELRAKILDVILGNADQLMLESYSYSDADGSQSTRNRSPKELWQWYNDVGEQIKEAEQELSGGGIRVFSTNRFSRSGL